MIRYINSFLLFLAYLIAIIFSIMPFLWFLYASFKPPQSISAIPPEWISELSISSYRSAIFQYNIMHFLKNSLIVAGCTTFITICISVLSGYALSRMPSRYSRIILMGILTCAMFPQISIAGPIWTFMKRIGWLNSYQGLTFPYVALTLPLALWIMSTFFKEIPIELEEAALIDGCTKTRALLSVVLPLSLPGVFTASILCFIYAWNEFFLALLIMSDPARQTMPVGIALFQGEYTIPWGEISAASLITTAPLMIMVFLFQRRIISGFTAGALKG